MTEQELCMALMRADTEDEVVGLLTEAGYWDNDDLWRYFGDNESNFSSIGNQQSEPVAALIEKLVNSVDARLLDSCLQAGVDPEAATAPDSIRQAVAEFFEEPGEMASTDAGRVALWAQPKTLSEAERLTLTATGEKTSVLSLTIADQGEGQTPDRMPDTFLSLHRNNKLRTRFVQGKFNMGGTGALLFCGRQHRVQLILSRRNPAHVAEGHQRDHEWGFTVVRREPPSDGVRSSVFTYLAPRDSESPRSGNVLSFAADTMPIFPIADADRRDAYARHAEYGSLVKLYDYQLTGTRSNIVSSGGGLLRRVDFGMPEMALPIRVYECRQSYRGHAGSFATNALGIVSRLERDRSDKLEPGFPVGHLMRLAGREIRVRAFALRESADGYRNGNKAVIYSINGQTHATHTTDFFRRKRVDLSRLADSLLVVVDCSDIDGQSREDMFMNSRDRLRDTTLSRELEEGLEQFLKTNASLRELKNRRREEEIANRLSEAEPLATVLSDLINDTPGLSDLLGGGATITAPFPSGTRRGSSGDTFVGKRFPTYFHHRKRPDEAVYERTAHLGSSARLSFETDAEDDYFHRDVDRGVVEVDMRADPAGDWEPLEAFNFTGPSSGIAHLNLNLPDDAIAGDVVCVRLRATDPSRIEPFSLEARLRIAPPGNRPSGGGERDRNRNTGDGIGDGAGGLALPTIIEVREDEFGNAPHRFDEYSAIAVVYDGETDDGVESYTFYVNHDNRHLLAALKSTRSEPEALRAQFTYSLVLYSMALLMKGPGNDDGADSDDVTDADKERLVRLTTRHLAGFVLPTLKAMSALTD